MFDHCFNIDSIESNNGPKYSDSIESQYTVEPVLKDFPFRVSLIPLCSETTCFNEDKRLQFF